MTSAKAIHEGDPPPYRLAAKPLETIVCQLTAEHIASKVSSVDEGMEAR